MIQILDPPHIKRDGWFWKVYDAQTSNVVRCFLCGGLCFRPGPPPLRPRVSSDGQLYIDGSYMPIHAHQLCLDENTEPLDYVLRQRGGMPHSFSLRN